MGQFTVGPRRPDRLCHCDSGQCHCQRDPRPRCRRIEDDPPQDQQEAQRGRQQDSARPTRYRHECQHQHCRGGDSECGDRGSSGEENCTVQDERGGADHRESSGLEPAAFIATISNAWWVRGPRRRAAPEVATAACPWGRTWQCARSTSLVGIASRTSEPKPDCGDRASLTWCVVETKALTGR